MMLCFRHEKGHGPRTCSREATTDISPAFQGWDICVPLRAFVPPADKLPWVEELKGDMDAGNGSGICSVLNKRVLTPFFF
jgi:hypothetical protein